jgi:hypothetical protein
VTSQDEERPECYLKDGIMLGGEVECACEVTIEDLSSSGRTRRRLI